MKRLYLALITTGLAMAGLSGIAEAACRGLVVRALVEAAEGELTLADLLEPGACPEWYRAAARVGLGMVPRAGSGRVIEGGEIRRLLDTLGVEFGRQATGREAVSRDEQVPERVVVRQARAFKSCGEIADFVSAAAQAEDEWNGGEGENNNKGKDQALDCAAARTIPEDASLELLRANWNAGLGRREFGLRCLRPEDCIPFLVWFQEPPSLQNRDRLWRTRTLEGGKAGNSRARLIKPGQTAMLTWEQAGIRVVLPVTCLEAGDRGEFVRVRFKSAAGTLRAEVVGAGAVRAIL